MNLAIIASPKQLVSLNILSTRMYSTSSLCTISVFASFSEEASSVRVFETWLVHMAIAFSTLCSRKPSYLASLWSSKAFYISNAFIFLLVHMDQFTLLLLYEK